MHIFFLVSNLSEAGGTQRVVVNLANEFIKQDNVTIINVGKQNGDIKFQLNKNIQTIFLNNDKFEINKKNKLKKIIQSIKYIFKIKTQINSIIKSNKSDNIIIAMGMLFSYVLVFLKDENLIKIGSQHNPFYGGKIINYFRKKIINKLDYFVVLNEDMKKNTTEKLNIKNCITIENPISFYPKAPSRLQNKKLLSIGRLYNQKGYDMLIEIWSILINRGYNDYTLIIVGDGPEELELKQKVSKYGIDDNLKFISSTKEIEKYYLESDIYLMSSRHEGMPMVLLEAQSWGLPIVSFDCPTGPQIIIENGKNGFLIPCFNKVDFANKIEELLINDQLRYFMGKEARKSVKKYEINNVANKWRSLFDEGMKRKNDE